MRLTGVAAFFLFVLGSAGVAEAQTATLPTQVEIQADYDAQKYPDVLRKVARVLPLKGDAAAGYDRPALLTLKAESHLRTSQITTAADTFVLLAKESTDEKAKATFQATALLIRKSKANKYLPRTDLKTGGRAAIDILEPEQRKLALAALYADETPATVAKIEAAKKSGTLPRIVDAARPVADLRVLELASSDSDANSQKLLGDLTATAGTLMSAELDALKSTVQEISDRANKVERDERTRPDGSRYSRDQRKGINSNDKAALNNVISTCQKIAEVTDELAGALKAPSSEFDSVKKGAEAVSRDAGKVLNDDYDTVNRDDVRRNR